MFSFLLKKIKEEDVPVLQMLLGQVWLERFLQLVISSPPKKIFLMENFSI